MTMLYDMQVVPEGTPRKNHFHVSSASAVCGLNKHSGPMDVYLSMAEGFEPDFSPEAIERMGWGNKLEQAVALEWYERNEQKGLLIHGETVKHPKHSWLVGTPDRLIAKLGQPDEIATGLEVKTAGFMMSDKWGESGSDQIPDAYMFQVALYCSMYNLDKWEVAVLIGGQEFRQYTYKRNIKFEDAIIAKCHAFMENHVLPKVPPPMDGGSGADDYLKSLYPQATALMREAGPAEIEIVNQFKTRYLAEKELGAQLKTLKQQVKQIIGEDKGLTLPDGEKVTFNNVKGRTVTDYKATLENLMAVYKGAHPDYQIRLEDLRDNLADLMQQHTTIKPGHRSMRCTFND